MVFIFLPLHIFAHLSSVLLYWRPNLRFGPWLRANCSVAKVNWAKRWMGKKKYGNPFAMPHLFALTFFCLAHSNFLRLELEHDRVSFTRVATPLASDKFTAKRSFVLYAFEGSLTHDESLNGWFELLVDGHVGCNNSPKRS